MGWLGWTLSIVGVLIGLVSLMAITGNFLKPEHTFTRRLALTQPPEAVYAVIDKAEDWPKWWTNIKTVERLPDCNGRPALRMTYTDGNKFDLILTEQAAPAKLVMTIDDVSKVFSGDWTYQFDKIDTGTRVTLTENGVIFNPIARLMARTAMNPAVFVEVHLKALAAKFGEPAVME